MRQIAIMLISLLIVLSFNACTNKTIILKCKTPDVEKPVFDNTPKKDILENVKKALINYEILKLYSIKLEEANKVCK